MLQGGLEQSGYNQIYAIAEGQDQETALEVNDNLLAKLDSLKGSVAFVKGAGNFIPSEKTQSERLARWNDFWGGGRAERLVKELSDESRRQGFAESAFSPFTDILTNEYSVASADESSLMDSFEGTYILNDNGKYLIVNQVYFEDASRSGDIKESLRSDGTLVFDTGDISNRLVSVLSDSFDYIGAICSLVVFVFLSLSFRRLELGLLSFFQIGRAHV